jgi:hypothetical protein
MSSTKKNPGKKKPAPKGDKRPALGDEALKQVSGGGSGWGKPASPTPFKVKT